MENLLRPQSAGEVLRNAVRVYRKHFGVVVSVYLLPLLPFTFLQTVFIQDRTRFGSAMIAAILVYVVTVFATVPTTAALSDVCLGNRPSVRRAYRRSFEGLMSRVLGTLCLQLIIMAFGTLLLVIPAFFMSVFFMFAMTVVVLEHSSGFAALRRSWDLGKGFHWRNGSVILLLTLVGTVASAMIGMMSGFIIKTTSIPPLIPSLVAQMFSLIAYPLPVIATVLLYYDIRVRKEAYDSATLAEDLRR